MCRHFVASCNVRSATSDISQTSKHHPALKVIVSLILLVMKPPLNLRCYMRLRVSLSARFWVRSSCWCVSASGVLKTGWRCKSCRHQLLFAQNSNLKQAIEKEDDQQEASQCRFLLSVCIGERPEGQCCKVFALVQRSPMQCPNKQHMRWVAGGAQGKATASPPAHRI